MLLLIDTIMAEIYCRQNKDIAYVQIDGTQEDTVYCIEKGNLELVETVNSGLKKVKESGKYDDLYEKYFSGDSEIQVTEAAEDTGFLNTLKFIFLEENRWQYYLKGLEVTLFSFSFICNSGKCLGVGSGHNPVECRQKEKRNITFSIYESLCGCNPRNPIRTTADDYILCRISQPDGICGCSGKFWY